MSRSHACIACDFYLDLPNVPADHSARCPRCDHLISNNRGDSLERPLALCLAASILLVCAVSFPFLGFSTAGQTSAMTLLDSALALLQFQEMLLGSIVFVLIFLAPAVLLVLLSTLLTLISLNRPVPWLAKLARVVFALGAWSMVEVFLISVLVSVAKITTMASVHIGISFWAFAAFTLTTALAVASVDDYQIWRRIEAQLVQ